LDTARRGLCRVLGILPSPYSTISKLLFYTHMTSAWRAWAFSTFVDASERTTANTILPRALTPSLRCLPRHRALPLCAADRASTHTPATACLHTTHTFHSGRALLPCLALYSLPSTASPSHLAGYGCLVAAGGCAAAWHAVTRGSARKLRSLRALPAAATISPWRALRACHARLPRTANTEHHHSPPALVPNITGSITAAAPARDSTVIATW